MAVLARATAGELRRGLAALGLVAHAEMRPPETGLVMVRGRIGGDGAPFNLGEATVTRCVVRLDSGEVGFSYVLGRDREKARLAALSDALWQNPAYREHLDRYVLAPLRARLAMEEEQTRARTAATRVDFFALVRGEDKS